MKPMTHLTALSLLGALGCNAPIPVFESLIAADEGALRGNLVIAAGAPDEPVQAAVIWNHYADVSGPEEIAAESAPLADGAPFSLSVAVPPIEPILEGTLVDESPGDPRIGFGMIVALREDPQDPAVMSPWDRLAGACADHVIVYVEADMKPQTEIARLMHGRLAAGLHLLRVTRDKPTCYGPEEEQHCYGFSLDPAPEGLDTSVEIKVAPNAVLSLSSL